MSLEALFDIRDSFCDTLNTLLLDSKRQTLSLFYSRPSNWSFSLLASPKSAVSIQRYGPIWWQPNHRLSRRTTNPWQIVKCYSIYLVSSESISCLIFFSDFRINFTKWDGLTIRLSKTMNLISVRPWISQIMKQAYMQLQFWGDRSTPRAVFFWITRIAVCEAESWRLHWVTRTLPPPSIINVKCANSTRGITGGLGPHHFLIRHIQRY